MNILLVDGYNVIHSLPQFRKFLDVKLEQARSSLIQALAQLAKSKKGNVRIHVFFDGKADADFFSVDPIVAGVEVHFSRGETADQLILDYLQEIKDSGEVTVVTDDRSLARQAGSERATILSSDGLGHRLQKTVSKSDKF